MKIYEVVEDYDECEVTIFASLDRAKCESIVKQMPPHGYAEVRERELDKFTFGEKMYKIDYAYFNHPGQKWFEDGEEIVYDKPVNSMHPYKWHKTLKATEVIIPK